MFDLFHEIFSTLHKNKLRTFLTGFSMSWGIFMLIVLLGSGKGLQNGICFNFGSSANNVVEMWPGVSNMPYQGLQTGRRTRFDDADEKFLKKEFPDIVGQYSPLITRWGSVLHFQQDYINSDMQAVYPDYGSINNIQIKQGRFINSIDIKERRKVVIIHERTAEQLFKDVPPVGKSIIIDGVSYSVAGVYKTDDNFSQTPECFVPFSTAQNIYNTYNGYNQITFSVNNLNSTKENEKFEKDLRSALGRKHQFNPDDLSALYLWDKWKDYMQTMGIFNGISLFIWIVGIGTLIAGIVGISNIMLITVKERTKEIGIRKSLGARPRSIMGMIITECLFITSVFGYCGMLLGIIVVEIMNRMVPTPTSNGQEDLTFFLNPGVDIGVVLAATLILVVAGVAAAYVPAKKAVKIKPIEALRYE